jgi:DNA-binding NtrC family response regulator
MPAVCRLIDKYCFDYLIGLSSAERVADSIAHASRMLALTLEDVAEPGNDVVGRSEPMLQLFRTVAKVASTNAPVFISGESGTGKELTASAIHAQSSRRDAPFVAINCGAIPHSLVQAELFGYERGAFTGANQRRIGKIEAAHNGTLFLDEIGDLPLDSQANLLRFLQEGQIQRVGSHEVIDVDVRVICATHVDIKRAVADGQFRNDLFHRLCVLRIDQPPLRERGEDIELIAMHMLERFRDESPRRIRGFSPSAISALYNYDWPGNVRELINRVRRAVVMAESRVITADDLELTQFATAKAVTLAEAREVAEQAAIQQALRRHRNRLNEAAQELGISRVTLYRLMGNQRLRQTGIGVAEEDEDELRSVA